MLVKEKVIGTDRYDIQEMDREKVDRKLASELNNMCDHLISQGLAQHRDEARVLIARVLNTVSVSNSITSACNHHVNFKLIGFGGYENSQFYKNVNFD